MRGVVIVGSLVLVAAAIAAVVRYQPLGTANFGSCAPFSPGANAVRPVYREGKSCAIGLSLANEGRIPVRVIGIGTPFPQGGLLTLTDVQLARPPDGRVYTTAAGDPSLQPFAAFSLGHGDKRWVVLRSRFGNCDRYAVGTSATWVAVEVTYEVLGVTKHQWVRLPMRVDVASPANCPGRS
ncbi:MAG: hypothetical protein HY240_05970 [Actinobacteria bacterium]|nr:hypothetical protein [Actinomycetota bacterium]